MELDTTSLKVAVLDGRQKYQEQLRNWLYTTQCENVIIAKSKEEVVGALQGAQCNALIINLDCLGADGSLSLIDLMRKEHAAYPICVLDNFPAVLGHGHEDWRIRLAHYYSLPFDPDEPLLKGSVELTARLFRFYLYSPTADYQLRELRTYLCSDQLTLDLGTRNHIVGMFLKVTEELVKSQKTVAQLRRAIVPGFDSSATGKLMTNTMESAKKSLEWASHANAGILAFGAVLVAASFCVAVSVGSWEAVSFGGFGIAGIVASLIASPLKSISESAKRLIQVQAAYVGFMNVVALINEQPPETTSNNDLRNRVELLSSAISKVLEGLERAA